MHWIVGEMRSSKKVEVFKEAGTSDEKDVYEDANQ